MSDTKQLVNGTVVKVNSFGAILSLEDGSEGFLHISELRDEFIRNMSDWVHEGLQLTLLPLGMDKQGKRQNLSVKQADIILKAEGKPVNVLDGNNPEGRTKNANGNGKARRPEGRRPQREPASFDAAVPPPMYDELYEEEGERFEDKLAKFMKDSNERQVDIKHRTQNKRGDGYTRH